MSGEGEKGARGELNGVLVGLVDASGAWRGSVEGSDRWGLIFRLAAWKDASGSIFQGKLRCELPVVKKRLSALINELQAYTLVEIKVKESLKPGLVRLDSVMLYRGNDPDLVKIGQELQVPVKISTEHLGVLVLDRRLGSYDGKVVWCGSEVGVCLSCKDPANPGTAISVAEALFQAQSEWNRRVVEYAVEHLLPLKNKGWLEEGEAELSREDFLSRMSLGSIGIDEDGSFEFWCGDGDMFWGHSIVVRGSLTEGPTGSDLPG